MPPGSAGHFDRQNGDLGLCFGCVWPICKTPVLVEVALHGASGDTRIGGNPVMAQAMALEPEDLHLALDPGVGVMVPVVGQSLAVVGGEGDQAHDRPTCWVPRLLLVNSLWPCTAAYNLCQTGPRRVYHLSREATAMILGDVFERFAQDSPLSVIARGVMENALGPKLVDELFEHVA